MTIDEQVQDLILAQGRIHVTTTHVNQEERLSEIEGRLDALEQGTPPPEPTPDPDPTPSGGNILGIDLAKLPKSGTAYNRVKALAAKSATLDFSDNGNASGHAILLAKAVTGDKAGVLSMVRGMANRDLSVHSLRASRNLAAIAIALNLAGAHEEDPWLRQARDHDYSADGGFGSIVYPGGGSKKANNHGSAADMSVTAIDLHLGDKAHLESKVIGVVKARFGDRAMGIAFNFGDLSFQPDPTKPVVICGKGAVKQGVNLDGILPEEQRRQGSFPNLNDGNYNFGAAGQLLLTCFLLTRAGYAADTWSDAAVKRVFEAFARNGWKPSGDDAWQGHMVRALFGTTITPLGVGDGKSFGLTDYLFGGAA